MIRTVRFALLGIAAAGAVPALAAEPQNPHVWKSSVKSVAVFKNGMGFFVRQGTAELRDGWCVADTVPPAVFGTFAIYSLDADRAVDVVGAGPGEAVEFDGRDGPKDAAAKKARLRQCIGLQVALTCGTADRPETVSGTLVEVTDTLLVLRQKGGEQLCAAKLDAVTRAQLLEMPLRVHLQGGPKEARPAAIGMAYLRKGVTWIPEYTLEVADETTAWLTLRGTFVNEAEDLVNADIHFVVGVPSFLHTEYLTPIAVGQAIRAVAAAVPLQVMSQMANNALVARSNAAQDERPVAVSPDTGNIDAVMGGLPQLGGAGASDFTVYTKTGMTVRKGEKAIVTIFRHKVAYGHKYCWTSPGDLRHFLVLSNDTDTAWTTGPVVAVSDARPLCEDLLRYTPKGGRCELPVTTAINIATDVKESEVDRKLKAHEPSHNVFLDLVTIEGRLRVTNREPRAISLEVSRTAPGLIRQASDGGRITQDVANLKLVERNGGVAWDLSLDPGQTKELTYRYERYVPSN